MTGLVKPSGAPITGADVQRARASAGLARRSHDAAGDRGTFMSGWRTGLRSADADWLYDRDRVVARVRDSARNDPVGASAGARKINAAVGFGWRLSSRVNARALGISNDAARELRASIESKFRPYAYGPSFAPDAERKKTFGQLLRMSASHIFYDGEALAVVEYASDEPTRYKTRLRVIDPDRLSNPYGRPDSQVLRGGIERNANGVPGTYWIREAHPYDLGASPSMVWKGWPRYSTDLGRPQVLHAYDELRAGQTRGISRFVSSLKNFRALAKFTDATLETAVINALFVGFVKSSAGPDAVGDSMNAEDLQTFESERQDHYKSNPVELDGFTLPVLPYGDEIDLKTAARDVTGFDAFTRSILRLIAASLGVTYEELSMDFSQTNYSSARAALLVSWNETLSFRGLLKAQIADPFYLAWLEEAIDLGDVVLPPGAPDFYEALDVYAECAWIGPARGYVDPTKEIDAAAARIEAGISTLQDECAEQGKDYEEVIEQQAYEQQLRLAAGLQPWGPALFEAGQDSRNPLRDQQLEQAPAAGQGSALSRVRAVARSAEHDRVLDLSGR